MAKNLLKTKVIGIGGSGVNAVSRMHKEKIEGAELIAVNTDAQTLLRSPAGKKILIGKETTGGLGAGMNVRLGEKAARENYQELKEAMAGAEMIFLTCGLGGGSGSPGVAVLGEISRELKILTVAVVTLPFFFEGAQRKNIAQRALNNLIGRVDAVLIIENDRLLKLVQPNTSIENAFLLCDQILFEAVKGISDLISLPGIINVDFADLKAVLKNSGRAFLGQGQAKGEKRAIEAAGLALKSPLLSYSVKEAKGVLLNIAGSHDLTLQEINTAATFIKSAASAGTKIIFGVSQDRGLKEGEMKITVIATSNK